MFPRKLWRPFARKAFAALAAAALFAALAPMALARDVGGPDAGETVNVLPHQLEGVGITEKLGARVDMGLVFTNEAGEKVTLGDYFRRGKPVMLSLAYYSCPNLCNYHLNGVKDALREMNWTLGKEFEYVVVSIDPAETPKLAAEKKANYLKAYGRVGAENGWHFLVGEEASVRALADQVGFQYRWDEESRQWAHSAAAIILTPSGDISRYLFGIHFEPQTMRLSLVEAGQGNVGSLVDKLILYCFHYDPKASKYTLYAMNVMRGGAALVVLVLLAFMTPFWLRQRRSNAQSLLRAQRAGIEQGEI